MNQQSPDTEAVEQAFSSLSIGSSEATAIKTLAEASRTTPTVREQLSDSAILRKLVEIVECSLSDDLETTTLALRCIGNACIDNEHARDEITILGFSWIKECLAHHDVELRLLAVKVSYNICSDHEPAQQQCYRENLHYSLIDLCASPQNAGTSDLTLLIDVLLWITGQRVKDEKSDALPSVTLTKLLSLPTLHSGTADPDDFASILEICLTFLRDAPTQLRVVQGRGVEAVWRMLEESEAKITAETEEVLRPLSSSLVWCLSDLAANEAFAQMYPLNDAFIVELLRVLRESGREVDGSANADLMDADGFDTPRGHDQREILGGSSSVRRSAAAYQIVGNLLWALEPEQVAPLVVREKLHGAAWRVVCDGNQDEELLHAATGFLIQLSRPSAEVRELIGADENAALGLTTLCEHKTPQLKQGGARLLRALGKDCPVNQQRFAELAKSVVLSSNSADATMSEAPS